jgi:hypothetical protein
VSWRTIVHALYAAMPPDTPTMIRLRSMSAEA